MKIVSPVAGDPGASGAALRTAYANVSNASSTEPVVLKLEPGTYDIGNSPLEMDKSDVHLEGSGREATIITGSGFSILLIQWNSSLSRLSVVNPLGDGLTAFFGRVDLREVRVSSTRDSSSQFASAVSMIFSAHGSLRDVVIDATNPSGYAQGLSINSNDPEPSVLRDVSVKASAGLFARGIQIGSSASLDDVRVESTWGAVEVIASGPNPPVLTITNSRFRGDNNGLTQGSGGASSILIQGSSVRGGSVSVFFDSISSADVKIAHTELGGPAFANPPNTLTCFGAYNTALQPLTSGCQQLP